MKMLFSLAACLLLAACQPAANPYTSESTPYPPAPAAAASNVDRSSYPPPQRDFALYHSWAWRNAEVPAGSGWASSQLFTDSISAGLDRRGLRPVQGQAEPDLLVSARVLTREVEIHQPPEVGGFYGHGPYGDGYGVGVGGAINSTQQILGVQIDLFDARSGQLVWTGSAALVSGYSDDRQAETLRETVARAMQSYPAD
ncbi:DUF4136 domain-containing protein [Pseudomonas sp. N040]|uniref:DUF4136 domain-containing protein n=1 Tax=Pseudomonas sp. N040 TaxID=2785325 RepID=UPI0018A28C50|nr:DUF4136 domain-containing protein [Pseudomonas sp. N040]MBF7731069.1 DUF4136 domain-containing protein [Pseudomonas sp. N040]MBW7014712.1 DUF4136 domain-containing protein [Pseudomonas sp. N040]